MTGLGRTPADHPVGTAMAAPGPDATTGGALGKADPTERPGTTRRSVGQLVVGPAEHGVVRFGVDLAAALPGVPLVRAPGPGVAEVGPTGSRLVHTQFTDRLFGDSCEAAAAAYTALAARVRDAGGALTVTLHDVPAVDGSDGAPPELARRRRAAYRQVVGASRGVVLCSTSERDRLAGYVELPPDRLAVIPLPVVAPVAAPPDPPPPPTDVAVLGFLYPGKGHLDVLAEMTGLPAGMGLLALGRASDGHRDLIGQLETAAASTGRRLTVTGFVPDTELPVRLQAPVVPVAPHRFVSASGSIATWWSAGRRPLVPDVAYTRELESRWPGSVRRYDAAAPGALADALATAVADPGSTWLGATQVGPSPAVVAAAYQQVWADWSRPDAR